MQHGCAPASRGVQVCSTERGWCWACRQLHCLYASRCFSTCQRACACVGGVSLCLCVCLWVCVWLACPQHMRCQGCASCQQKPLVRLLWHHTLVHGCRSGQWCTELSRRAVWKVHGWPSGAVRVVILNNISSWYVMFPHDVDMQGASLCTVVDRRYYRTQRAALLHYTVVVVQSHATECMGCTSLQFALCSYMGGWLGWPIAADDIV